MLANIRHKNGICYTTAIPENVGVNTSIFGPQFYASKSYLEFIETIIINRNVINDGICRSSTIKRHDTFIVAIPEDRIFFQRIL